MKSEMFSVIVPLYNKEKYIKNTINSVLSQTISSFELIIVDDGSTDGGSEIVKGFLDSRIRLIQQENMGVSAARNRGISESKGDFICFLDADDMWKRDFLQTAKNLLDSFPKAGMVCPSYQVSYAERIVHPVWKSVDLEKDSYVEDFYEMATAPFWICHSSCAVIRRETLQKMKYWFPEGEAVYEDFDFWIRLGEICKVAHSNKICVTYQRETPNNARQAHMHKIVYSRCYMNTLNELLERKELTSQQKEWIKEIKDRRMVPFIFSLYLTGDRRSARRELNNWKPCKTYCKYKTGLILCNLIPNYIINKIQQIRIKVF